MKKLAVSPSYKSLLTKVSREFSELEDILKRRTTEGIWKVGKYIDEHLLEHKDRADYGTKLFKQLARDVGRDKSTLLRSVQFYRAYPIVAPERQLQWEHYKSLIAIKDEKDRKKLEDKIIRQDWNTKQLKAYLHTKRELTASDSDKPFDSARGKPVPQLTFNRGRLNIYQIVRANEALARRSPLALDLGFREQHPLPTTAKVSEGDTVELIYREGKTSVAKKVEIPENEIFTYQACVDKVIDGDTLLVSFDFHLDVSISQKLRLRGIDCPEIDTEEGKKAKRFVEARLKNVEFIIVKTYKDRTDKFDRYLADVFYRTGTRDANLVTREGNYLNQELLDNRLAIIWK